MSKEEATAKRGPGRPRTTDNVRLQVRLPREDYAALMKICAAGERTPQEHVVMMIRRAVRAKR